MSDQTLESLLGFEFLEVTPDRVVIAVDLDERHRQSYGITHGGVYCALVESAASHGAVQWLGGKAVGVSNTTDFLRPTSSGRITATATPVHRGRTQQLWGVEIVTEEGKLAARGQVRMHNLEQPQ